MWWIIGRRLLRDCLSDEGDLSADIFLPSILESQTRHQAAYRPSIIMHTAGHSCFKLIAGTLGPWVTKPNLKTKILKPEFSFPFGHAIHVPFCEWYIIHTSPRNPPIQQSLGWIFGNQVQGVITGFGCQSWPRQKNGSNSHRLEEADLTADNRRRKKSPPSFYVPSILFPWLSLLWKSR